MGIWINFWKDMKHGFICEDEDDFQHKIFNIDVMIKMYNNKHLLIGFLFIIPVFLFHFTACVSTKKYNELVHQNNVIQSQQYNFQNRIAELENLIQRLRADTARFSEAYNELTETYGDLVNSSSNTTKALNDKVRAKEKELQRREKELNDKIKRQDKEIAQKERTLKDREKLVSDLQKTIAQKENKQKSLIASLENALFEFSKEDLQVERRNGKVYVSMSDKLLFKSGEATLGTEGKRALSKVAEVVNRNPDIEVTIEGHTDNVPLSGTGVNKDNWDLSVRRATSVVRVLTKEYQVPPTRVLAAGRGEFSPIADNDLESGKARNRRTEIILMPKLDAIYNVLRDRN